MNPLKTGDITCVCKQRVPGLSLGRGLGTRQFKMLKIEFWLKYLMETVSDILWRGSCPARKQIVVVLFWP